MTRGGIEIDTKVEIQGIVHKVIIRDLRDGYTSFLVKSNEDRGKLIFCTGNILPLEEGIRVRVNGRWEQNGSGWQITNAKVKRIFLDENDVLMYLLKSNVGIGAAKAKEIVTILGLDAVEYTMTCDIEEQLLKVRGVHRLQAKKIIGHLRKHEYEQSFFDYLILHGGEYKDFDSLNKMYGYEAYSMLKKHPYQIGRKSGLKFIVCDSISKENGGLAHSAQRLEYGIRWALQNGAAKGHTYLRRHDLMREAQDLLKNAIYPDRVSFAALQLGVDLALRSGIIKEEDRYYLQVLRDAEKQAAEQISRLSFWRGKNFPEYNPDLLHFIMKSQNMELAPEQIEAFELLQNPGIKALIGGPGTGKTTVAKVLIAGFLMMKPEAEIILCAPTGRAAQRLSESTGRAASTMHRFLELSRSDIGKDKEMTTKSKLYIVDEASMINIEMASLFLSRIEDGAIVIFLGDTDQLPAIGAGNFFSDLSQYRGIQTVELTKVYRQAKSSVTIQNAKLINLGIPQLHDGNDFEIIQAKDNEIPNIVPREFIKYYDPMNPYKVQVLACTRKLVNQMNGVLQKLVNPAAGGIRYGGRLFKVGDKIIMTNNNYKLGYFNGDVGKITNIFPDNYIKVRINQLEILITIDELEDMDLGYAMTVHKAQGSEYQVVLFAFTSTPRNMLSRKILYTGITRGKDKVVLITEKTSIAIAVANNENNRNSMLLPRIEAIKKKRGAA